MGPLPRVEKGAGRRKLTPPALPPIYQVKYGQEHGVHWGTLYLGMLVGALLAIGLLGYLFFGKDPDA
jgi:hypothetical protein